MPAGAGADVTFGLFTMGSSFWIYSWLRVTGEQGSWPT